ncbi:MAG: hypothetical protein AAGH40_14205 [Verrucomicrobiota bacterium]
MALRISYAPSTWTERLAIAGLVVFALILVQITTWKESEIFWMNIGGYPLWLRDCVHTLYYPYLLFVLTFALMLSRSVIGRFFRDLKVRKAWLVLFLAWIIICGSLGLLVTNNLINLIESRPLHYHDPARSGQ